MVREDRMTLKMMLSTLATLAVLVPAAVQAQEFVMKVSAANAPNPDDPVYGWMLAFEKGVEERSGGRIDVQLYPSSQLGQQPAAIEGASMGTIEATVAIIGLMGSIEPRFQVLDASGAAETPEGAMRMMQSPEMRDMLAGYGEAAGVKVLSVMVDGQSVIVSKTPIETVADFQGLKVRSAGATPLINEPLVALGASPVSLPLGEVVPALQTGTIDAATSSMAIVNTFKMADVARNVTYLPGSFVAVGIIANRGFLDSVGPELAAIIEEEADKAEAASEKAFASRGDKEAAFEAAGGRVIRFSDEEQAKYLAAIEPVVADVVSKNAQMKTDFDVLRASAEATR